jgi:hypothetical protein
MKGNKARTRRNANSATTAGKRDENKQKCKLHYNNCWQRMRENKEKCRK